MRLEAVVTKATLCLCESELPYLGSLTDYMVPKFNLGEQRSKRLCYNLAAGMPLGIPHLPQSLACMRSWGHQRDLNTALIASAHVGRL